MLRVYVCTEDTISIFLIIFCLLPLTTVMEIETFLHWNWSYQKESQLIVFLEDIQPPLLDLLQWLLSFMFNLQVVSSLGRLS